MGEFERCLTKVLVHEGGYSNHPKDPGGATMKGVTQRVYDDYRDRKGRPRQAVKGIDVLELNEIYRSSYWDLIRGDELPAGVSYVVFDGAVNSGVKRSVMWLQKALGVVADGVMGPATIAAANAHPSKAKLINAICTNRMAFLEALKTYSTFGKGWSQRVAGVEVCAKAWASNQESNPARVVPSEGMGDAKAVASDVKKAPSAALGDLATGLGAATVAVTQAQAQLAPYASIGVVAQIAGYLTAAGVVLALIGIAYKAWATVKGKQLAAIVGGDQ